MAYICTDMKRNGTGNIFEALKLFMQTRNTRLSSACRVQFHTAYN